MTCTDRDCFEEVYKIFTAVPDGNFHRVFSEWCELIIHDCMWESVQSFDACATRSSFSHKIWELTL